MNMKWIKSLLLGSSAALLLSAIPNASAQSVAVNASGSSALFLGLGRAAFQLNSCVWTAASGHFVMTDPTVPTLSENGQEWVSWVPATAGDCTTVATGATIYAYQQTDSVIGDRCLFNGCTITNNVTSALETAHLVFTTGTTEADHLPDAVIMALGGEGAAAAPINAAGTDVRPEDALFATNRALIPCGATTDGTISIAPYLGLGYAADSSVQSFYSTATYHVVPFSFGRSTYNVTPVAASAVLVAVNHTAGGTPSAGGDGFLNTNINNVTSGTLANVLDGTYSRTRDLLAVADLSMSEPIGVLEREPLSGTYNTMEYNVPNTLENTTSQDVGVSQPTAQRNCSGSGTGPLPGSNPMDIATASGGSRTRVIGTGESTNVLFNNGSFTHSVPSDAIAYAFWSTPNFAHATGSSRYLTVDGVDPLQHSYSNGAIPLAGSAALANVTLEHIQDGSYPVWSLQRLVDIGGATGIPALVAAAQSFPTFGSSTSEPDYIPVSAVGAQAAKNLGVVRSHFTPPTVTPQSAVSNGTDSRFLPEDGGDVGGVVYTKAGDSDFCTDFQGATGCTGKTEHRR